MWWQISLNRFFLALNIYSKTTRYVLYITQNYRISTLCLHGTTKKNFQNCCSDTIQQYIDRLLYKICCILEMNRWEFKFFYSVNYFLSSKKFCFVFPFSFNKIKRIIGIMCGWKVYRSFVFLYTFRMCFKWSISTFFLIQN